MKCENIKELEIPSEFVDGAIESEEESEDVLLGVGEVEKGVWKVFNDVIYNQNEVDAYSCTVVATYTALSNLTGKTVPYSLMNSTLSRMRKDGKFKDGVGAYLKDGVKYALEDWNEKFKTNYKAQLIVLSPQTIVRGLKSSPIVTGIKYGKGFVSDTQDNAWLDGASTDVIGNSGHAITIVKVNTLDDVLIKLCNTYAWRLLKNVFGLDFNKYRKLFFNTGYFFTK